MTTAKGGEIFVRRAPACTTLDLAKALAVKHSPRGVDHPIQITGSRPGEKLHEVLVNEYEMQRVSEADGYFVVHPEYGAPLASTRPFGEEYTSANTTRLTDIDDICQLLAQVGVTECYT
jgi:FlaA1/EpsC-like NDP-sugar epimerase